MSDPTRDMTEAELASYYDRTRDLSEFEGGEEFPVEIRRNVTISVRFSEEEIAQLRERAEKTGVKVTAYIRAAALQQAAPLDRASLRKALNDLSADVARAERLLGA